jgi:magnesium-transporting ATPase (P-type)
MLVPVIILITGFSDMITVAPGQKKLDRCMKWFLKCVLVTFLSMQLVFILVILFENNPNKDDLLYLMVKGTQLNFLQLFSFFIVFDIILKKLSASKKFFRTFKAQLLLSLICIILVFFISVLYDRINEPEYMKTIEIRRYLRYYDLFFLFVPVATILNFLISKKRNLSLKQTNM